MGADILKRVAAVWRSIRGAAEQEFYMVFRKPVNTRSSHGGGQHLMLKTTPAEMHESRLPITGRRLSGYAMNAAIN
ncbi:hypothetical protein [Pseudomonas sp. Bi70]|uniref:hypothetical protein n=1 Tax=Pseudomonas sp. Bi70 TaxID=2821127 RepID=UPI001E46BEFC|nr:hypothetical protein [Pseudomonas sp. Bi70]